MAKAKGYSLWLRPFGNLAFSLQRRIEKLSREHNTPIFEPHVTLLGGLDRTEAELNQFTDMLAHTLDPFDIVLTRAQIGDDFFHSVFIEVQKTKELVHAHQTAAHVFDEDEEADHYHPHLSLLYGNLEHATKERILNKMGREFHLRFTAQNLLLVRTEGEPGEWEKIHSANFEDHGLAERGTTITG